MLASLSEALAFPRLVAFMTRPPLKRLQRAHKRRFVQVFNLEPRKKKYGGAEDGWLHDFFIPDVYTIYA